MLLFVIAICYYSNNIILSYIRPYVISTIFYLADEYIKNHLIVTYHLINSLNNSS